MFQSIIIYLCLAIITSALAEITSRVKFKAEKIIFGIMTILIPSFIASIRYDTGTDYYTYVNVFNNPESKDMVEIGYMKLNLFIKYLGGSVEVVFFIMSATMMTCILLSLLKNKSKISVGLGMFIFMLLYYQRSYNIMRQMTAVSILTYAISFIEESKFSKFICLVILASTIHYSSIIILPFYFIMKILKAEDKGKLRILFIILFTFFFFNYDKILLPIFESNEYLIYYSGYLKRSENPKFGLSVLVQYLPYIISCLILHKNLKKYNSFNIYYLMLIIGVILELSVYFFVNGAANRIALIFIMPIIVLLPMCIKVFLQRRNYLSVIFLLFFVVLIWYNTYFYQGFHETVPYNWIF